MRQLFRLSADTNVVGQVIRRLLHPSVSAWFLGGFGMVCVGSIGYALVRENMLYAALPLVALVGLLIGLLDVAPVFWLLMGVVTLSKSMELPGGLSIDLPSEPLMLLLLGLLAARMLLGKPVGGAWLRHPITFILVLQLCWAAFSGLLSVDVTHSLKYLLAKCWYLAAFFIAGGMEIYSPARARQLVWVVLPALLGSVLWATLRHAATGFAFSAVNQSILPFYFNHVIYATTLALFVPWVYYAPRMGPPPGPWERWALRGALALLLLGVTLAYTRATWGAVLLAAGWYVLVRWRLTWPALLGLVLVVLLAGRWLVQDQHYLRFSPDYETTIWHGNDLGAHLSSTVEMKDVSGMERVYRWVAAARMVAAHPLLGSGPSTFYPEYKHFTDKRFRTYVSDNPEKSTTHNYFLLLLAEQGIPGLVLFLLLLGQGFGLVQHLYHRFAHDPARRATVLAAGLSFFIIVFHLTLNELVEVDKIGGFFYLNLAVLLQLRASAA